MKKMFAESPTKYTENNLQFICPICPIEQNIRRP